MAFLIYQFMSVVLLFSGCDWSPPYPLAKGDTSP